MKKIMTLLSMIALAFVGTMMIGCSNKEYDIEKPEQSEQPVGSPNVITLTTTINLPDTDTKALDIDYGNRKLSKTFAEDERIAVLYRSQAGGITRGISDTLRTEDITNGGKTATFTITVYDPVMKEDLTYVYPAAMAGGSYPNYHIDYSRLNTQDGTLASIASDLDLATFTGPWDGNNLPSANLTNELAIIAYTLKDENGSDVTGTITRMTINDGTNNYTVNRYAAAGPIYVAIRPTNDATINYTATDGITNTYTKTVSDKTYKAGQFYQLGLRMTPSSSATGHRLRNSIVGEIVGTDGLAYAVEDKNKLPIGVTAAGMVAYKSGPSGLVIALSDESSIKTWPEAVSAAIAHTPAVTGHAWRMPSLSEWKQMFAAFGGSETSSTGLKTAITNAGGNTLDKIHYWTSTDKEGNPANAYYIGLSDSNVTYSYTKGKTDHSYARACFAFDFGLFSVSSTTKVKFAPGNLTYTGSTWEFLSHSWEYNYNGNCGVAEGSQYFQWTDVFNNRYSAGESAVKDAITSALGASWRGLSKDEWSYLLGDLLFYHATDSRTVAWHKYAYIKKGGGCYLLIFPDDFVGADWTAAMGTIPTSFDNRGEQSISYTEENFSAMQSAGIVILPPTGRVWRGLYTDIKEYGVRAWYWTKELDMHNGKLQAASLSSWNVSLSYQVKEFQDGKCYYNPVRLVKNVE